MNGEPDNESSAVANRGAEEKLESAETTSESDAKTPEIAEAISKMAPPVKKMFEMFAVAATSGGPRFHPIFDKFEKGHVDKFLDNLRAEEEHEYHFHSVGQRYSFGYFLVGVLGLGWLVYFLLPENKELLLDTLKMLVVFAGGFGSGIGWKAQKSKRE